jgi:phage tail protein X
MRHFTVIAFLILLAAHRGVTQTSTAVATLPAANRGDPARLIGESTVSFRFSDRDLSSSTILTRLQGLCLNHGVVLRFASRKIELRPVKNKAATPRFVSGFRPAIGRGSRLRTYALNDVPLRTVLEAVCLTAGLGYTLDRELGAIVLVDPDHPGATWCPDLLPADRIAKALGASGTRDGHMGRTILVQGDAVTAVQGIADYIITLKDGVRVCLPQAAASQARFEQVRKALRGATPDTVHITAMGVIRPESSAQGLTLGGAVLLEVATGLRYSVSPASTPARLPERAIQRIGD